MNILLFLIPKNTLAFLYDDMTVRQAYEKMRAHNFTAVPLINRDGEYVGSISEGDLLYAIVDNKDNVEDIRLKDIVRKDYIKAVKVDEDVNKLLDMIINQNFVAVVDDRNILMGIVTRRSIINHFLKKNSL